MKGTENGNRFAAHSLSMAPRKRRPHLALESLEGHPAEIAAAAARLLRRDAPPLRRPQADIAALPRLASGREQGTCRGTWARVTIDRFRHIAHFKP